MNIPFFNSNRTYKLEHLFSSQTEHGEGPIWDPVEQKLYWVDIGQGCFLVSDVVSGKWERHCVGQALGVLRLREKGGLVMGVKNGFGFWDFDKQTLEIVSNPEEDLPGNRFNDGAMDVKGRFFAGTMGDGEEASGNLYCLFPDMSVKKLEANVKIANGMGWSPDNKTFYFTDSPRRIIYKYDYDLETGQISRRKPFIITVTEPGVPDGLTIDSEGGLWVAFWDGWKIIHYDSNGKLVEEIPMPVQYPTSCCFGGPDLKDLFITTSRRDVKPEEAHKQPLAGDIFRVCTKIKGKPEPKFKG